MQPTPARSPTAKPVTSAPTALTRPTISWPGTIGNSAPPHSSLAWWMSLWQMPLNRMSIWTSRGPTARRSIVVGARGEVFDGVA